MKIVGYTYYEGQYHAAMKSDSSLLNQRKPFFLPDWTDTVSATPCMVLRISRMGRSIEPRFAGRYCDQIALGVNFRDEQALSDGKPTEALAFEGALAVGTWLTADTWQHPVTVHPRMMGADEAIAAVSRLMTLRTGDMLFIDYPETTQPIAREDVLSYAHNGNELLYCKIK